MLCVAVIYCIDRHAGSLVPCEGSTATRHWWAESQFLTGGSFGLPVSFYILLICSMSLPFAYTCMIVFAFGSFGQEAGIDSEQAQAMRKGQVFFFACGNFSPLTFVRHWLCSNDRLARLRWGWRGGAMYWSFTYYTSWSSWTISLFCSIPMQSEWLESSTNASDSDGTDLSWIHQLWPCAGGG